MINVFIVSVASDMMWIAQLFTFTKATEGHHVNVANIVDVCT